MTQPWYSRSHSQFASKVEQEMDSERRASSMTRRQFVTSSAAVLALSGHALDAHAGNSPVGALPETGGGPLRVVIDTDPGVDDALALLLARARRS